MAKELPESMDELVYFTRRKFAPEKGKAVAWAYRKECPECKKGKMQKPTDEKTGKIKIRAKEYVCPECGYAEDKGAHEESLVMEIIYECPFCGHAGETDEPYKRKSFYGEKAVVFACGGCGEKLGITKKMKMPERFAAKLEGA